MKQKKVCILGLGYIGFPTAILFANNSFDVYGVEKNKEILNKLDSGIIHIEEPNLKEISAKVIENNSLTYGFFPEKADIFLICVPTPIRHDENNKPDLSFVKSAVNEILPLLEDGNLIVLESTSPVGTVEMIQNIINKFGNHLSNIKIAYCPERVLPGNIIHEMINNDRIVGGIDEQSTKEASNLYREICEGNVYETDAKTAELCKLAENSFRDINIAFANELSLICDKEGIDVGELIELSNKHPRVDILTPGIGVGGHCIPVDPWFIVSSYPNNSSLIQNARKVNNSKTEWVFEKILKKINHLGKDKPIIACFGLSYKPNADDIRESPAIKIVDKLISAGNKVICVEPHIDSLEGYEIVDIDNALKKSDINIMLVCHDIFRKNKKISTNEKLLDFCGVIDN